MTAAHGGVLAARCLAAGVGLIGAVGYALLALPGRTALAIGATAVALLLLSFRPRVIRIFGQVLGAGLAMMALLTWTRMAPGTAFSAFAALTWISLGITLATLPSQRRELQSLFVVLATLVLSFAGVLFFALLLGVDASGSLGRLGGFEGATVVAALFAACSALLLRPDVGWVASVSGDTVAARSARRLIGWIVLLPAAIASVSVWTQQALQFDPRIAIGFGAVATTFVLAAMLFRTSRRLQRLEHEREQATAAMRASEGRLQLATRALRGYVYDWDVATGHVWRGGAFEDITGFALDEVPPTAEFWGECILPEDRERTARERGAAIATNAESFSAEYRVRHKNGHPVWIWDHSVGVRDADGKLVRVVGNVLDISARKHIEGALRDSERRFRAAVAATSDIFWTTDATGELRRPQPGWSEFTGQSEQEYAGTGWAAAVHPEDATLATVAWRAAVAAGKPYSFENRLRRHDGAYRRFAIRAVPVHDDEGHVVEWVGVHRDITEQRMLETELRETSQRLELAMTAANIGIWSWGPRTQQIRWSAQCHEISGVSQAEFEASHRAFERRVLPEDLARFRSLVDGTRGSMSTPVEFRFRRPDGTIRWAESCAVRLRDGNGEPHQAVGTLLDVTERKDWEARQEALLDAERAARAILAGTAQLKDDFLATISHELRTPLNAMLGWAALLRRPTATSATIAHGLAIIERNGRLQARLIDDLFDANRLMSGKFDFDVAPLDPQATVRAAIDAALPLAQSKQQRIAIESGEDGSVVNADARRLQQVIGNLLSNAMKFSPADSLITVRTRVDGLHWICEVQDHGEGISRDFLPHVFDRFRQAESGRSRRHGGLGLGLAISRQIVSHLGGDLTAASDGPGCGATFRLKLPISSAIPTLDAATELTNTFPQLALRNEALAGLRILAVDDEPEALEYLTRILAEQGAAVESAMSAEAALEKFDAHEQRFDVLISDIGMPVLNGYDLVRRVRERGLSEQQLPAVAVTAFARDEDRRVALRNGFQRHIAKPVEASELIRTVRAVARSRATR
jgi:PAS domain S-box-containing protein